MGGSRFFVYHELGLHGFHLFDCFDERGGEVGVPLLVLALAPGVVDALMASPHARVAVRHRFHPNLAEKGDDDHHGNHCQADAEPQEKLTLVLGRNLEIFFDQLMNLAYCSVEHICGLQGPFPDLVGHSSDFFRQDLDHSGLHLLPGLLQVISKAVGRVVDDNGGLFLVFQCPLHPVVSGHVFDCFLGPLSVNGQNLNVLFFVWKCVTEIVQMNTRILIDVAL